MILRLPAPFNGTLAVSTAPAPVTRRRGLGGFVVFCPDDTSREPLDEFVRCKLFPPVSDGHGHTVRYYQRAGTPPRL